MFNIQETVSAFTSSLVASLRFVVALDLALLLLWMLGETTYSVLRSEYGLLTILFAVTLIATLSLTIWRFLKPKHFGMTIASSTSLNIISLTVLDLVTLFTIIFVSDQFQKPLTTPLLHFCQTLIQRLTG